MPLPDRYCVIGNPIAHSRSPRIHSLFAQLTGQTLVYEAELVALDGFDAAVQQLVQTGTRGMNVTVPFKLEAAGLADSCSDRVQRAGAANTLVVGADGRIHADNTDGLGLVADIVRNAGVALAGQRVLLLGAGGAAAGALAPLIAEAPALLVVCNRTHAKAQHLVDLHADLVQGVSTQLQAMEADALAGPFDVVINATASSLQGAAIPVPGALLRPGALAYDMMYGPAAEPFLQWARQHGATGRDGLGMLVEQAAEAFALWRGVRPPSQPVLAQLRSELAAH
ncbi:shikimate dehydrogenase [Comamonas piscis]